jgi:hypothetical protein
MARRSAQRADAPDTVMQHPTQTLSHPASNKNIETPGTSSQKRRQDAKIRQEQ